MVIMQTEDAATVNAGSNGLPTGSPWMTSQEVADYVRMHPETVLLALRRGELKGLQKTKPRGSWRIRREDVDRWMAGEKPAKARARKRNAA